jgi:formimidoylglutamate deiminase
MDHHAGDGRRGAGGPATNATRWPSGIASLHSHAFQRGMAGLAETRGNTAEYVLDMAAKTMMSLRAEMTPEDTESQYATLLYAEMLEQGFTRVGESIISHHDH